MLRRTFLTCILLAALVACAPATATPVPLPTLTDGNATATPAAIPSTPEPSATETPEPPTQEPGPATEEINPTDPATQTQESVPTLLLPVTTAESTDLPEPKIEAGAVQMYGPGPMSKVVSPIVIYGYAIPGYEHKGRLELYGEDGRLLASELIQLNTALKWAYFNIGLTFNVSAAGELGRLSLITKDEYGRLTAVYSVHLLLMPEGDAVIYPPGNMKERCVIDQPLAGKRVSGGTMTVSGRIRPYNNLPLVVELIAEDGSVLGSQLVLVTPAADDSYVPFSVNVPYSVTKSTGALLTVRQSDDRIGGTMYLYSQEVLLNP